MTYSFAVLPTRAVLAVCLAHLLCCELNAPAFPAGKDLASLNATEIMSAARTSLLDAIDKQPVESCVLWLTAAHAAAYGCLPDAALHALGHVQRLFVLGWEKQPIKGSHVRVSNLLSAARAAGRGGLACQALLKVTLFPLPCKACNFFSLQPDCSRRW